MTLIVAYNLITDAVLIPVNTYIIFKEFTLEFFQIIKKDTQHPGESLAIGLVDITDFLITMGFFLNPYNWFVVLWKFIIGDITFNPNEEVGK